MYVPFAAGGGVRTPSVGLRHVTALSTMYFKPFSFSSSSLSMSMTMERE